MTIGRTPPYFAHLTGRPAFCATIVPLAALAALAISGCSAGRISQTAQQVAAVNGRSADIGDISLRNIYLTPSTATGPCVAQHGGPIRVAFTAVNNSSTTPDRLIGIASDAANSVAVDAPAAALVIAPKTTLAAGQPIEQVTGASAPDTPIDVVLNHPNKYARPGLTVPLTFTFEKAGATTVDVALDACPTPPPLPATGA
ncbi:copper chaperone PCu(A)C [Antrihabitans cavernicola]|uniref:Copper chaperone PCu(A)C n=1 Tax=Antrihabitans cavernicola TaxID=2495913 RepID=A0A5A7S0P0_9NOCA|nr:copper chaperone PCu(A)C [Spelaeibacter cavernicola]KAA0016339.1 copper chaperone PCu(A)C [Spelaeibacter cavernicola]